MEKAVNPLRPQKMVFLRVMMAGILVGALLWMVLIRVVENPFFCETAISSGTKELQLFDAIVHYATSRVVPQQTLEEISVTFDVLKSMSPCNFLVFGLGRDSVMWASLNPHGTTLFIEESQKWVQVVLKDAPYLSNNVMYASQNYWLLKAKTVTYRTKVSEADNLLTSYQEEPECWPGKSFLHGNEKCKLALNMLPEEVYNTEWDLIMIDAPRGYIQEVPGRMAVIYSAAVMARNRKRSGVTHVFVHDVDRKVENVYSDKFLCRKYMVEQVGKLRHYEIPPTKNNQGMEFC